MVAASGVPGDEDGIGLRRWRQFLVGVLVLAAATFAAGLILAAGSGRHVDVPVLVLVFGIFVAVLAVAGAVGWRLLARAGRGRVVMRADWSTRRRVGADLRKGRPIRPADRETAAAIISLYETRGWVAWLYLAVALLWGSAGILAHGFLRWWDLGLVAGYLCLAPVWWRQRSLIVRRGGDLGEAR